MEKPRALLLLFVLTVNVYGAMSASYTVGDGENWALGVDFGTWSNSHQFFSGDILVFNYNVAQHDVYEVDQDTYTDCNSNNGTVFAKYQTGNDQISLREAKTYWFICNAEGHCLGGMRFRIVVNEATVSPPPPPDTATPDSSLPPPPPNSGDRRRLSLWIFVVGTTILFKFAHDW